MLPHFSHAIFVTSYGLLSPKPPFALVTPQPFHIRFLFLLSQVCIGEENLTCGIFFLLKLFFSLFLARTVGNDRVTASPPPPRLSPLCIDCMRAISLLKVIYICICQHQAFKKLSNTCITYLLILNLTYISTLGVCLWMWDNLPQSLNLGFYPAWRDMDVRVFFMPKLVEEVPCSHLCVPLAIGKVDTKSTVKDCYRWT